MPKSTTSNWSVERLLTLREVAELLRVSTSTVRRLIRTGALPAVRVGGQIRLDKRDVRRFVLASRFLRGGR